MCFRVGIPLEMCIACIGTIEQKSVDPLKDHFPLQASAINDSLLTNGVQVDQKLLSLLPPDV